MFNVLCTKCYVCTDFAFTHGNKLNLNFSFKIYAIEILNFLKN